MDTQAWIDLAQQKLTEYDIGTIKGMGILPDNGRQFFPVIAYPPLTMYQDMGCEQLFKRVQQRAINPMTAYVHIPFCPSRCTFCHWITKTKTKADEVDTYLDYLEREMVLYKQALGVESIPVRSVLVGGGTPTYLSANQMERFLTAVATHFDLSACTQFSIEAEPTTLLGKAGFDKLQVMKNFGVQRISMGVQSFDDAVTAAMGRVHSRQDTLNAIEQIRKVGIENIFIDLIYAYPKQTIEQWVDNLQTALSLDIQGYQLYRLRVKPHGDREGNIVRQYAKSPEIEHTTNDIYLMKMLGILLSREYGYGEHQTRIFAKSANDISHYLRDWCCDLTDVVGIGVSAWSNLRGVFGLNVGDANLQTYYNFIAQNKVAINRGKVRTRDDEIRRNFILPLKNTRVSKVQYHRHVGESVEHFFADEMDLLKTCGLLREDDDDIALTDRGRFFADEIATQFFNPAYLPFPDVKRIAHG